MYYDISKSFFSAMDLELPEVILPDIMSPGMDGISMMNQINRKPIWNKIPIMMVSAKRSEVDKLIRLDLGADNYLTKPFGVLELVSRVKALLRRTSEKMSDYLLEIKRLLLNTKEDLCPYNETSSLLTSMEFQLLKLLMQNHQKDITRNDTLNIVWEDDFFGETRTLDVHIKELRIKLSRAGIAEESIQTVRGVEYKFII